MKDYFAADLGASNGRAMLGRFDGRKLTLRELCRFENSYQHINGEDYWDVIKLYANIKNGLAAYAQAGGGILSGIGIDTWGVDFGLIDRQGKLIGNPRSYRDPRGKRGMEAFHKKYGEKTAFDLTGIANLEFNTIYQLYDMAATRDPQLEIADKLLMLPDLLGYMLCGGISAEYTDATTTQMLDGAGGWSKEIINMLGLHEGIFPRIQKSGTIKGALFDSVKEETGLKYAPPVFCVGSHDTASAVASVPAKDDDYAFISSGTWSLIGVVSDKAIINDTAYANRFSNEGTVDGTYRPLRNVMGLWIIQNCKKQWDGEGSLSWDDIVAMAGKAPAFKSFIDVSDSSFFTPDDMTGKIQRYCAATGQPVPQSKGEIARTVYESLAMSYREAFRGLEEIKGKRIGALHIVGGGSKNSMLNRLTANAVGREVIAGPAEATAIGNIMVQVLASGEVADTTEMRQVIRDSFEVECFEPENADEWTEQFNRYLKIKEGRK